MDDILQKDTVLKVNQWPKDTIEAGHRHTVGIKLDGTVMAVGDNKFGQCEVSI